VDLERRYISWTDVGRMVAALLAQLPCDFDNILVITRGGMVPACLISEQTNIRNIVAAAVMFYTGEGDTLPDPVFLQFPADPLLYGKRIIVVDDVWDTGRTIVAVKQRIEAAGGHADLAVLHYKPTHSKFAERPDYYADTTDAWIVYPWDPVRAKAPVGVGAWKQDREASRQ
jgi:hypoxanthine phosphoribosyltransferase